MPTTYISGGVRLRAVAVAVTVAMSGCGGGGTSAQTPSPQIASRAVEQSDLQIAQSLYDGDRRTPQGFYVDAVAREQPYVATMHLKNTDLDSSPGTAQPRHELCTNDWNEALTWSEAVARRTGPYTDLVETNDEARFFEFGRVRPGDPQFYVRARVFKCAYVDRSAADLRSASGAAGRLNVRPATADELQRLSEYLWLFTSYNNSGNVVLKSAGVPTATGLAHTIIVARLVRASGEAQCDRIDVIAWRHELVADSGQLSLDASLLWSFGARDAYGVAQSCTSST